MHPPIPVSDPGLADLLDPELQIGLLAALGLVGVEGAINPQGFGGVTMAEVAAAAGMSKKTLYVMFADKESLLRELVSSSYLWDAGASGLIISDPVEEVRQRLWAIARHVLSARHINLCRLAIGESIARDGVADTFLEMGVQGSRMTLVEAIQRISPSRLRLSLSPDLLAGMLFGATCSINLMTAMLSGRPPNLDRVSDAIDAVVGELFVSLPSA